MAQKPPRPCRHPGCTELTRTGYCPRHQPQRPDKRESAQWHWMYLTRQWRQELRPAQLLREPFCRVCARRGARTPATRVDHIQPHRGDWALFTDPNNLQSLCEACHNRKTAQERGERRRKVSGF